MDQLKSEQSEVILNTLSPLDPEVQRYLYLSKEIERVMGNADDKNQECVPIELVAEFFLLQDKLYTQSVEKHNTEAN